MGNSIDVLFTSCFHMTWKYRVDVVSVSVTLKGLIYLALVADP